MTEQIIKHQTPHIAKHVLGDDFSFILRDTECNSKVFGACEFCGKDAVQIFSLRKLKSTFISQVNRIVTNEVYHVYGHRECLMNLKNKL